MVVYVPRLSRRATLAWLAAATALAGVPGRALAAAAPAPGEGYGTDPDLVTPSHGPWPRILAPAQLAALALLADAILPAEGDDPAPSAIGLAEFLDEWVSAPYPAQTADRAVILAGLAAMDAEARARFGHGLAEASADQAALLLGEAAKAPDSRFFRRLRHLVVGGYYSSDAGAKAIGYQGNVALAEYPGAPPAVLAVLERELAKRGL